MKKYYNVTVIYFMLDIKGSVDLEIYTQFQFRDDQYIPKNKFGGYLECFSNIDELLFMELVIEKVDYDFEYYHNINLGYNGRLD